jgi:26S proteasome regulatory subunit (ATPase 3-interacting protein)
VLKYLKKQKRPFGVNDVVNNLKTQAAKKQVTKALTTNFEQGLIRMKQWGKTLIYAANLENLDENEQEQFKKKIKENELLIEQKETEIKKLTKKLNVKKSQKSVKEITPLIIEIKKENKILEKSISDQSKNQTILNEKDEIELKKKRNSMLLEWKKRKGIFKNMWDSVLESYDGKPKTLKEKIGIETEEDYNISIKDYYK